MKRNGHGAVYFDGRSLERFEVMSGGQMIEKTRRFKENTRTDTKLNKRKKSCDGKVRYNTEKSAEEAVIRAQVKRVYLSIYKCKFCGLYHIGHEPWRKKKDKFVVESRDEG